MIFNVNKQSTPYSCGPAAVSIVAQILGFNFKETELIKELNAQPNIGTDNQTILNWCNEHLPVSSAGENTYMGGLSIWNIQNALSGVGHFVVVLGMVDNKVRYFDPYWATTFEFDLKEIIWRSGDSKYLNWSINFKSDEDFYNLVLNPNQPFNQEWAMVSLTKWINNNKPKLSSRMCPSGGGKCSCTPAEYCKHP